MAWVRLGSSRLEAARGASAAGGRVEAARGAVEPGRRALAAGGPVEATRGDVEGARGAVEATRGASVTGGRVEAARGGVEPGRRAPAGGGPVEAAREEVGAGVTWVREAVRSGLSVKALSSCSSTGSRTANLWTPTVILAGSLARYCGPVSALWRGLKLTTHVRTTPWVSGET